MEGWTRYRLVMYQSPTSQPETAWVVREWLAVGQVIEVEGYQGPWRVVRPHVPSDATEPEPNTFDCEPANFGH